MGGLDYKGLLARRQFRTLGPPGTSSHSSGKADGHADDGQCVQRRDGGFSSGGLAGPLRRGLGAEIETETQRSPWWRRHRRAGGAGASVLPSQWNRSPLHCTWWLGGCRPTARLQGHVTEGAGCSLTSMRHKSWIFLRSCASLAARSGCEGRDSGHPTSRGNRDRQVRQGRWMPKQ